MYKSLLRLQLRQCLRKLNLLVNVDQERHEPGKEESLLLVHVQGMMNLANMV